MGWVQAWPKAQRLPAGAAVQAEAGDKRAGDGPTHVLTESAHAYVYFSSEQVQKTCSFGSLMCWLLNFGCAIITAIVSYGVVTF